MKELSLLLKLLENESVSSATAEKMSVVRNLVKQLQPSGECDLQIQNSSRTAWLQPLLNNTHMNNYNIVNEKIMGPTQQMCFKEK